MQDILACPLCGMKLQSIFKKKLKHLYWVEKTSLYTEKRCTKGYNHSVQLFVDVVSGEIDLIKFSIEADYSKFVEIDFLNKRSRINCLKMSKPHYIDVPIIIEPDFPKLEKLKEKVSLFVMLS